MKYKMVCIDVDGTLMGHRRVISEESKGVLIDAHKKGVEIVITTGRPYNNAEGISRNVGVKSPVIAANGAIIREKETGKVVYSCPLSENSCKSILEVVKKYKVVAQFYTENRIFCNTFIGALFDRIFTSRGARKELLMSVKWVKTRRNLLRLFSIHKDEFLKCVVISVDEKKIKAVREEILNIDSLDCFRSGKYALEIITKGVSKGNAVKILSEYLGYSREEIICIGDNENDISMINYAGLGVAMGNAINEVKEIADYVTDSNVNDGVAKAVRKFVL